mgnify:CR=1 FL=1
MSDLAEPIPGVGIGRQPRAALGYTLCMAAAVLFAINGTVAKSLLVGGFEATRLSQLRVTAAFIILLVVVAITRPRALRIRKDEILPLLAYSVLGLAMTQFLYFVGIQLLPVGVALLIEFTAPIMVALWFRFGMKEQVNRLVWVGLVLALTGLALVGQVWMGFSLNAVGVIASFGAAASLAVYFLLGDAQVRKPQPRDAVSLTMWGFGGAALFWAVVAPWWTFPFSTLAGSEEFGTTSLVVPLAALAAWMIILGTVIPFWFEMVALQNIRASQAAVVGMTEPLVASAIAWIFLGEVLTPAQILGAVIVLCGVFLAERSR